MDCTGLIVLPRSLFEVHDFYYTEKGPDTPSPLAHGP